MSTFQIMDLNWLSIEYSVESDLQIIDSNFQKAYMLSDPYRETYYFLKLLTNQEEFVAFQEIVKFYYSKGLIKQKLLLGGSHKNYLFQLYKIPKNKNILDLKLTKPRLKKFVELLVSYVNYSHFVEEIYYRHMPAYLNFDNDKNKLSKRVNLDNFIVKDKESINYRINKNNINLLDSSLDFYFKDYKPDIFMQLFNYSNCILNVTNKPRFLFTDLFVKTSHIDIIAQLIVVFLLTESSLSRHEIVSAIKNVYVKYVKLSSNIFEYIDIFIDKYLVEYAISHTNNRLIFDNSLIRLLLKSNLLEPEF